MASIRRTALYAATSALALTATLVAPTSFAAEEPTATDGCLTSVPDPGTDAAVEICYTIHKPGTA